MTFRIVYNAWWMFWAEGMVFGPWVWFRGKEVDDRLFRHELQHCYQIERKGRLNFYFNYIRLWFRHGYRNHPYEIEAYMAQTERLKVTELSWKAKGRITL